MAIVAYVTGHGLGHAAREITILRDLPEAIPLIVKTRSPEWFWRGAVTRPFTLLEDSFDVGCLQTDSLTVDVAATRAAWLAMDAKNRQRIDSEAAWLRSVGARVVLTDVAPFPLTVAAALGIPGVCVANFTWADIYAEYDGFTEIVAQLRQEYAQTTLLLDAGLSLPMPYFPRRESVGLVARIGTRRVLDIPKSAGKRVALIYAGNWGLPFPWERLASFDGWTFITLTPPNQTVANLTALAPSALPHEDLVASVDCVISKAGYGIVGECLAAGTPVLYGPRVGFAEFAVLDDVLQNWPGGIRLSDTEFLGAQWPLERVPARADTPRHAAPGASAIIDRLVALYGTSG